MNLTILGDGRHAHSVLELAKKLGFADCQLCRTPDVPESSDSGKSTADYGTSMRALLQSVRSSGRAIALGRASVDSRLGNQEVIRLSAELEMKAPKMVHRSALLSSSASVGRLVQIYESAIVKGRSYLSDGTILQAGVILEHDCYCGLGTVIGAGAVLGGSVRLEDGVYIGLGAVLRDGIEIGTNSTVGMGSTVVASIPSNCVVYGNPARVVRTGAIRPHEGQEFDE